MNRERGFVVAALVLIALMVVVSLATMDARFVLFAKTTTEQRQVAGGDAQDVSAELRMGSGDIQIRPGAGALLDATFEYNVAEYRPDVEYTVSGQHGRLRIAQPATKNLSVIGIVRNRWDLKFDPTVPLALDASTGSGGLDLAFDGGALTSLVLSTGSGSIHPLRLSGEYPGLESITTGTGSGSQKDIRLDGRYPALSTLVMSTGSGSLKNVTLSGEFPALAHVALGTGSGSLEVDLRGQWGTDATIEVGAGSGSVTLRLPDDVNLRVEAKTGSGKRTVRGLDEAGGDQYTRTVEGSAVTLTVRATTGSGSLNVRVR